MDKSEKYIRNEKLVKHAKMVFDVESKVYCPWDAPDIELGGHISFNNKIYIIVAKMDNELVYADEYLLINSSDYEDELILTREQIFNIIANRGVLFDKSYSELKKCKTDKTRKTLDSLNTSNDTIMVILKFEDEIQYSPTTVITDKSFNIGDIIDFNDKKFEIVKMIDPYLNFRNPYVEIILKMKENK